MLHIIDITGDAWRICKEYSNQGECNEVEKQNMGFTILYKTLNQLWHKLYYIWNCLIWNCVERFYVKKILINVKPKPNTWLMLNSIEYNHGSAKYK